jgi:hypothetical protein
LLRCAERFGREALTDRDLPGLLGSAATRDADGRNAQAKAAGLTVQIRYSGPGELATVEELVFRADVTNKLVFKELQPLGEWKTVMQSKTSAVRLETSRTISLKQTYIYAHLLNAPGPDAIVTTIGMRRNLVQ